MDMSGSVKSALVRRKVMVLFTFPDGQNIVKDLSDGNPLIPRYWLAILVIQVDRIHELSVNIELLMVRGAVADADRLRASISVKMAMSHESWK